MSKGDKELKSQKEAEIVRYLQQRSLELHGANAVRRNSGVAVAASREQLFLDQLQGVLKNTFKDKLPVPSQLLKKPKKSTGKTERILNVILSDTHYGSNLDPREVGHSYGPVEEARRTAAICKQVAEYKQHYRGSTELYIHLLGDVIQGQLYDARDGLPLAEQVASAMRILTQAVRFLAVQFPRGVTVFCTPGNHGRNTSRHKQRAVLQKHDAIETMVYVGIKGAVDNLPNVKVIIGYEPKYDFGAFDKLGFATHGDSVINVGYPGRSIDVGGIKKQANDINNARASKSKKPYGLFIFGHVHVGSLTHLPGGVIVITNGCLIPPDSFANSIGIFDTACGQWMWESVPGHMVGDSRFIGVGEENDVDSSLDSIIKPYSGY